MILNSDSKRFLRGSQHNPGENGWSSHIVFLPRMIFRRDSGLGGQRCSEPNDGGGTRFE